jgi:uncharacterized surface protein with fasciclin (FAS1) repeats
MVSINPATQSYDFRQMYNFSDIRSNCEKVIYPANSLMDIIDSNEDFSIFCKLVKKTKYDSKLSSNQSNFTLFVPSDFYLKQKYNLNFLNNIDIGLAHQILNFSTMNRILDKKLLQSSPTSLYPVVDRSLITISTVSDITMIENEIKIIHWNKFASNGIIHVIDNILIPKNSFNYS